MVNEWKFRIIHHQNIAFCPLSVIYFKIRIKVQLRKIKESTNGFIVMDSIWSSSGNRSICSYESSNGLILDTLLGIVGAFLGGWIMSFFNKSGVTGFNLYSFLVALLGAVILIAIVRGIRH
jgi:uncharacterized membrane protein YeaQ/YmgE (transglycosylase-associated protein family)